MGSYYRKKVIERDLWNLKIWIVGRLNLKMMDGLHGLGLIGLGADMGLGIGDWGLYISFCEFIINLLIYNL